MKFTYDAYRELLNKIRDKGYRITDYKSWQEGERSVILRHDIDTDINKAVKLASIEKTEDVQSTYFVLITSDFYNVFSKKSRDGIKQIMDSGHTIGLHFDEVCYPELSGEVEAVKRKIMEEAALLGSAIGTRVDIVSMHRPSQFVLEADMDIPGMINSYGQAYFKEFKYLSDSRRRWREPVDDMIESGRYEKFHILTHPFWYSETEEDIHEAVSKFINGGNDFRYQVMTSNITDMGSIMTEQEVIRETDTI